MIKKLQCSYTMFVSWNLVCYVKLALCNTFKVTLRIRTCILLICLQLAKKNSKDYTRKTISVGKPNWSLTMPHKHPQQLVKNSWRKICLIKQIKKRKQVWVLVESAYLLRQGKISENSCVIIWLNLISFMERLTRPIETTEIIFV